VDIAASATDGAWSEAIDVDSRAGRRGTIVLERFDYRLGDATCAAQKLSLLGRIARTRRRVAIVSTADVLPLLNSSLPAGADSTLEPLYGFDTLVYPGETSAASTDGKSAIDRECSGTPELRRIGRNLAPGHGARQQSPDERVQEVLDRASGYYLSVWKSCTDEERFSLFQLAEDGMANPMNRSALRHLMRKGLVLKDPQYRFMNESFRRFAGAAPTPEEVSRWSDEAGREGWGRVRGGFIVGLVLVAAFLFATQQEFLQTWTGYVTAAVGGMGMVFRLLNSVRPKGATTRSA
jgi:hypothetical protein